ncbi:MULTISPECIES: SDR family NAD(P)-dependent oxidoreductase [Amycolatopsis]|uniref:SDR family NAD(P)-dependent oxidoreductase n=1 Tax=Amycolatopsis albidoflavus TaxID=102226 RepID=A0ABW5I2I6_9PSEU
MLLTPADLALFADASGDRNPLHVDPEYARRTPFGQPVAHGVLTAVAALDEVPGPPGEVTAVDLEFRRPTHAGFPYSTNISHELDGRTRIAVTEGQETCLTVWLTHGPAATAVAVPRRPRSQPRSLAPEEFVPGLETTGQYGPGDALDALMKRWPGTARLLGRHALTCLVWCSFVAGMELPGRDCLLNGVSLKLHPVSGILAPEYRATVRDFDPRFGLLTVEAALADGAAIVAEATLETMVRRPVPAPSAERLSALLPASDRLYGHTAAIVGGSRGLGAALVLALASQGARVLVGHRSGGLSELADHGAELGGEVVSCPGDAADPAWSEQISQLAGGKLDLLICSAAPPIRPLRLDPAGLPRVQAFVADAFALVSAPLAGLLPAVAKNSGRFLLISSAAVTDPPEDWPHYVAVKHAVEGLTQWAAARHSECEFFISRPGMLLTEQMNTPGTREIAQAVEPVAAALADRLANSAPAAGRPEIIAH